MHNIFRPAPFIAALLIGLLLMTSIHGDAQAVTLYKWVDAQGNISYQDTPPPAGQKYEERSFSDEGARTGDRNAEIALTQAVLDNPVILYRAANCESCDQVESILNSNKLPYEVIEADVDEEAQRKLQQLVGSVRVPTLTIGDEVIDRTNRATIEDALRQNGYPQPDAQTDTQ